jgi:hypothetical protein
MRYHPRELILELVIGQRDQIASSGLCHFQVIAFNIVHPVPRSNTFDRQTIQMTFLIPEMGR